MATFEKKTWTDRVSEYPTRRTLTYPASGVSDIVTVERNEGQITNQGDAFNATNMNDLESRIDTCIEAMNSNFQAGVDAVYAACVAEGVTPSASSPTAIAAAISNIRSGGTAQAAHILNPYTAYSSKVLRTGSMVNRGAWTGTSSGSGNVTIPQGYHNGNGYVNCSGAYNDGRSQGRQDVGQVVETVNGSQDGQVYLWNDLHHYGVYMGIMKTSEGTNWPEGYGVDIIYTGNLIGGLDCRAIWAVFKVTSNTAAIWTETDNGYLPANRQRVIILGPSE